MGQPLRILYVEDDEEIRQVVTMSLALDPTIEVATAGDGASALALLATSDSAPPDLLLLDYTLGSDDGVELAARLRERPGLEAVPLIFLTARLREREHARMRAAGAAAVLHKPFNPLTLARELRAALAS